MKEKTLLSLLSDSNILVRNYLFLENFGLKHKAAKFQLKIWTSEKGDGLVLLSSHPKS